MNSIKMNFPVTIDIAESGSTGNKMVGGSERLNSGNDIIEKLNVKNAKIIAVCLVLVCIIFHGIRHLKYGEFNEFYTKVLHKFCLFIIVIYYIMDA